MDENYNLSAHPGGGSAGPPGNVEAEVLRRYSGVATAADATLCCPTDYEAEYLELLPKEIIEKDYGCGNPSRYVNEGETVVDLGSGAGKICYILSQKVGSSGKVVGVDFNDDMLALARKYRREMAGKLGYDNVTFVKGKIQDMALSLDKARNWLAKYPVNTLDELAAFEAECDRLRAEETMIPDGSVDVVVSNCVLNLVKPRDKAQLFDEIHRVLKRGGRAVISDIVCDEDPTPEIKADPELWSGCVAGAFREDVFLDMFEKAGFYGVQILARQAEPWQIIDGVEFRSMTLRAYKGKEGPCIERNQAVVYNGPWKSVTDDDGHTLFRGKRMALCDKTYNIYTDAGGPYLADIAAIPPLEDIPLEDAAPFDCEKDALRHPRRTKGRDYNETFYADDDPCRGPDCC